MLYLGWDGTPFEEIRESMFLRFISSTISSTTSKADTADVRTEGSVVSEAESYQCVSLEEGRPNICAL